ncbi:unnamed protein product [Cunninghamella blakesleeana]
MSYTLPTIRRIAIIGGGPGGLVTAKQLKAEKVFDKITIFERKEQLGGTWVYSPEVNDNPPLPSTDALKVNPQSEQNPFNNLNSPIYPNLHTNLPTNVMQYRDFDFDSDAPLFPTHKHVLNYLNQFATKYELNSHIKLNTSVIHADYNELKKEWNLTLQVKKPSSTTTEKNKNENDSLIYNETFDALIVATGHYSIPYVPDFDGIEHLKKNNVSWNHSRDYRHPDIFKNKNILIIGSGSSALDIVRETSFFATKVYHCVRSDTKQSLQAHESDNENVERIGLIHKILEDGQIQCIKKKDQEQQKEEEEQQLIKVDHIIFATGYLYSYPFLPFQKENLIKEGQTVLHTHEFMFYINNPTLAFIGLPIRIVPFPLSQSQANVIAKVFNPEREDVNLPSLEVMQSIYQQQYNDVDDTDRKSFVLTTDKEFNYVDRLSAWAEGHYNPHHIPIYTSSDPSLTAPLSDEWKQQRKDSLTLRKEYLGY